MLREIYRVRSGGLPEARHVSTPKDLRLLLPVDVGAGRRLFVLDLSQGRIQGSEAEDRLEIKGRDLDRLRDRKSVRLLGDLQLRIVATLA